MQTPITKLSNYQKVLQFNKSFGVPTKDLPHTDIFAKNQDLLTLRLALIDEEVAELHDASRAHDFTECIDALTDIMYVTLGAFTAFGVDADKAFDIVHKSNMSKLCTSEQEAQNTVEWYTQNEKRYNSPSYRKSDCGNFWVVYNESTGKVLKNINYTPAAFSFT